MGGLDATVKELRKLLDRLEWGYECVTDLHRLHEVWFLTVHGMSRRRQGQHEDNVQRILDFLVERLPGSHGLLYHGEDEGHELDYTTHRAASPWIPLVYHVRVLAKGVVTDRLDPFLSPRHWVVEDPQPEGLEPSAQPDRG